jgi:hypothetical protein
MSALGRTLKMQITLGNESSSFRADVAPTDLAKTEARIASTTLSNLRSPLKPILIQFNCKL